MTLNVVCVNGVTKTVTIARCAFSRESDESKQDEPEHELEVHVKKKQPVRLRQGEEQAGDHRGHPGPLDEPLTGPSVSYHGEPPKDGHQDDHADHTEVEPSHSRSGIDVERDRDRNESAQHVRLMDRRVSECGNADDGKNAAHRVLRIGPVRDRL